MVSLDDADPTATIIHAASSQWYRPRRATNFIHTGGVMTSSLLHAHCPYGVLRLRTCREQWRRASDQATGWLVGWLSQADWDRLR
jgi:hypothetical protein